jgi:AcrR family transcriptional regulator
MPAPRSGKRPYHHGNLRQAVIEAAIAIAEESGAESVSVREAARRAGVSSGAPFRHFATRTDLMTAVAEEGMLRLRGAIDARLARLRSKHPLARLLAIAEAYVNWVVQCPTLYRIVGDRTLIDFEGSEVLSGGANGIRTAMSAMFEEARDRGVLRENDIDRQHFESRALAYGLARMHVDEHLREWGIAKTRARAAMHAALRGYIVSLAKDPDSLKVALEEG